MLSRAEDFTAIRIDSEGFGRRAHGWLLMAESFLTI